MNGLSRLLDSLLPALIHLNPMVAMAYYQAVAMDEGPHHGATAAPPRELVFHVLRGMTVIDRADVPEPGLGRIVTRASR